MSKNKRIHKITPKGDLSWYVKWVSVFFVIVGWMLHSVNLYPYNIIVQVIGVGGWLWVGYLWHDRALIVLNSIGIAVLSLGIMKYFFGA